jgi:Zn-dependent protease
MESAFSLPEAIHRLSILFPPFMIAVIFHEFAHGWVANYWGDTTAKDEGRLTLNPAPHIDPIGTLLFPAIGMMAPGFFMIGWARPVPINPNRFRKYRPGLFWVSFAGPLMNFSLGTLFSFIYCALIKFMPQENFLFDPLTQMSFAAVFLNFGLGVFNLLPLPPLDGSKMLESFLSYNATRKFEQINQYSFFILIGLMLTGAFKILLIPALWMAQLSLSAAVALLGIDNLPLLGF